MGVHGASDQRALVRLLPRVRRSLDWCCSVELLFLVGAPQQAFERLAGRFFAVVEWVEKNMLGWDIPGEEDMIPQYENIRLFYPRQHAYTFDQYRCAEHLWVAPALALPPATKRLFGAARHRTPHHT